MDKNEAYLLNLLDKQNYQEAVDFVFGKNNSTKNGRIKFLRLIGEENLLDLFTEREKYLKSLSSSKKKISYTKFATLAKFSEEFNLLEDMVVDQALKKRGLSSIDDLMDKMNESNNNSSSFMINQHTAFNNISNFVKNREWNGIERRLKPR